MGTHLSLMHGWIPMTLQLLAATTVVVAVGWRTRRWRLLWLPVCAAFGLTWAAAAYSYLRSTGIAADPAPVALWVWIALTGLATSVVVAGWREGRWWRRGVSLLAVPLSLLCAAATINDWVGYVPTLGAAWTELTSGPLPDQTDRAAITAMQLSGTVPTNGAIVSVNIDSSASGFRHRDELVYLPPAWFASTPPPLLPAVMMIGGEFNTPTDWLRAGNAVTTLDGFAVTHGGQSPVFVFVDSGGGFNVDTECVNGSRGNAADHLTKDVVPYLISQLRCQRGPVELGRGGLLGRGDLRGGPDGDAPRDVRFLRRHRRGSATQRRDHDPDHRPALRGQSVGLAALRPHQRDHPTRPLRRGFGAVRGVWRSPGQPRPAGPHPQRRVRRGQPTMRPWRCSRHRLRHHRRRGQARLALRRNGIRDRTAMAGRPARHTGQPPTNADSTGWFCLFSSAPQPGTTGKVTVLAICYV